MLVDFFNGYVRAHRFGNVAQIKIMREPFLVFTNLWFLFIYFIYGCLKNVRDVILEKERVW
jgi:hypothetical protein